MKFRSLPGTAIVALFVAVLAPAATVTFNASSQGWVNIPDGTGPNANYIVGNCGLGDCGSGEYRNYFSFSISGISGTITSAVLSLDTYGLSLAQSPSITYQVTSLGGTFGFADLGTGTLYGSRTYSGADSFEVLPITLNQAAMSAISAASGGTFSLGGRISSGVTFGAEEPNQLIFGGSDSGVPQLIVNYSEGNGPVETPEPASIVLAAAGLLGLAARSRR